jgi:hypothetical protein
LTTHTNIRDKKIPIPENPKRKIRKGITQDQKKIRILSYLQSKREPVEKSRLLDEITQNVTSRSEEHTTFLTKMIDDKLIGLKSINPFKKGIIISEKGKEVIDLIKLIQKFNPDNPILSLDLFHMTKDEREKIERREDGGVDFKKIFDFDFAETEQEDYIKKIKEDLGF